MQEERSKVLEMVAAGTITDEQARQLLDAIGWGVQRPAERPRQESNANRSASSGGPRPPLVPRLTAEELVELASHGVSGAYLRELRAAGIHDLTVDEVVELSSHGVN